MIRTVRPEDAAALCTLYNHYIESSIVTFEEEPVSVEAFRERIESITTSYPWLVYEADGDIAGYVYASAWKARRAYRYAAESTVYLTPGHQGKGIGTTLYERLIADLKDRSVHCLIAGIALPNDASVALHEKIGFTKVANFREVGRKFDRWIDVAYWELIL